MRTYRVVTRETKGEAVMRSFARLLWLPTWGLALLGATFMLIGTTSTASAVDCGPRPEPAIAPEPGPPRTLPHGDRPMLITEDCVDPRYNNPQIDSIARVATPQDHWVVHGRFVGSEATFAFYYPVEGYQGRFWQGPVHQLRLPAPVPGAPIGVLSEGATDAEKIQTFASGAYLVESSPNADYALTAWLAVDGYGNPESQYRVGAAAAKFSRVVAAMPEFYGPSISRPYGYLFGGSGGAYITAAGAEETIGVWDGFVPFVMGQPLSIPDSLTVRLHTKRVLDIRNKFPEVMDAIDPGGSGDPYATLNDEEAAALREATRMGFPPRGWYKHATLTGGPLFLVAAYVPLLDPTYENDFWTQPGYLGTDPTVAGDHIRAARYQHHTTVTAANPAVGAPPPDYSQLGPAYNSYMLSQYITGPPRSVTLESLPPGLTDFTGASLVIEEPGRPADDGTNVYIGMVDTNTNTITFQGGTDPRLVNRIMVGDHVRVDNGLYLALQTHQRHTSTNQYGDLYAYNQYRSPEDASGTPIYPQRPLINGAPSGATGGFNSAGAMQTARPHGKVIVLNTLMDIDALHWPADWYRTRVQQQLAPGENIDDHLRVWFNDYSEHSGGGGNVRTVSYRGALQQALRDVATWAEQGVAPSPSTSYQIVDTQPELPPTAAERHGIQPVVQLTSNGLTGRAGAVLGQPVTFTAKIEVPPGTGDVVAATWDFDEGDGSNYPAADQPAGTLTPAPTVTVTATHTYSATGTYFVTLKGTSQREGNPSAPVGLIDNLDRVRIVVPEPGFAPGLVACVALVSLLRRPRTRSSH